MGSIDPEKIQFIEAMIKASFQRGLIISTDREINQEFVFNEGTDRYHLIIARRFLDNAKTVKTLGTHLQQLDLVNWLKQNPYKIVYLNGDGKISITPTQR